MEQTRSKIKELVIGDLVTHVLYGREWIGIVCGFKLEKDRPAGPRNERTLVQIQPGTKHEGFFSTKVSPKERKTDNLGYVITNWLYKIEIKDGKVRPARDKPQSGRK